MTVAGVVAVVETAARVVAVTGTVAGVVAGKVTAGPVAAEVAIEYNILRKTSVDLLNIFLNAGKGGLNFKSKLACQIKPQRVAQGQWRRDSGAGTVAQGRE